MKNNPWLRGVVLCLVLAPICIAFGDDPSGSSDPSGDLVHISGGKTGPLEKAFNDEKDTVRLILILSPS